MIVCHLFMAKDDAINDVEMDASITMNDERHMPPKCTDCDDSIAVRIFKAYKAYRSINFKEIVDNITIAIVDFIVQEVFFLPHYLVDIIL